MLQDGDFCGCYGEGLWFRELRAGRCLCPRLGPDAYGPSRLSPEAFTGFRKKRKKAMAMAMAVQN